MTNIEELKVFANGISGKFFFDYDLKKTNWFNIGGRTKAYFKPETLSELILFIKSISICFSEISSFAILDKTFRETDKKSFLKR